MSVTRFATVGDDSEFVPSEHTAVLADGTSLFYRAWLPQHPTARSLVIFHRGHEHSGRVQDIVEALALRDLAIFAWDARGHGRTPGPRGYAPSFATVINDVEVFIRHLGLAHQMRPEQMVILAQSVGAVSVAAWAHDYAPRIRGMVLAAPAFEIKLYVPLAIPSLRLLLKVRGHRQTFIKSYVRPKMLTHDQEQARRYEADDLIAKSIAANVLVDLHDTSKRLIADAGAIQTPTLLLSAGADWVVKLAPQRRFFERLGAPFKRMKVFPRMYHDLLHEQDRSAVLDEARAFIQEAFDRDLAPQELLAPDRSGYTLNEYDRLTEPLPWHSARRWAYRIQQAGMRTVGRLSEGVRLGWRTGFDSGQTLDYVYENRPRGALLLGRWIDRGYLNSIGWRGIRKRRINLEKLLAEAIGLVRASGQPVRLVDIAAGPGRYVLKTLERLAGPDLSAVLRDNVEANLQAGRQLALDWGISNVTFQAGDAFDEESLAALDPAPNIAVVSGLYELFPDNDPIRRSLRGLFRALSPGGYLVYTCQPWHPQVEMIGRVLVNREGQPWIMRRRTQQEMDDLIRVAGFEKLAQEIDPWGIFTVSLARRAAR
ncbi:MAG TPA: bifunctional alpha/beta hydrolase/class I SAM-dependent methyltransferase [Pirellulales bacterium]|jgi:alpha-beta hydrolase superfamily lysophospholipase/SAM-dependent methyltransferase|nr:bifunctional alpha/beta hydrolase/class I SAM-dependent methyltransferase [Pirellulales bacterium]